MLLTVLLPLIVASHTVASPFVTHRRHKRTPGSSEAALNLPVAHVAQIEDPTLCWLSTDGMHRKLVLGSTSGAVYTIQPTITEISGRCSVLH